MSPSQLPTLSPRAIVIGSSGGIGAALVRGLRQRGFEVTGLSRSTAEPELRIDLTDEATIAAAAERLHAQAPFSVILVSTGILHEGSAMPERTLRELGHARLMRQFAVNAVGPALVAKHFVPLLPRRGRSVFAALSARIGSISDNRRGGWYGYRASKAALNMLIKTLAIELARTRPDTICVGLHPGTVDTQLSKPFQTSVPAGSLLSAERSAAHLLDVVFALGPGQSGGCFAWDGTEIDP